MGRIQFAHTGGGIQFAHTGGGIRFAHTPEYDKPRRLKTFLKKNYLKINLRIQKRLL
jgi:hypothetical protein